MSASSRPPAAGTGDRTTAGAGSASSPAGRDRVPLLEVRDLRSWFDTPEGTARAVDGVSFHLDEGETLALVGESGCGKSVTALSLLRLLPTPPARILPGSSVRLRGEELLEAGRERLRSVRGGEIGMVFQEPMTSLNPVRRVGSQVVEGIRAHRPEVADPRAEAVRLLARVGLPDPGERFRDYPHQLSGGQRQRVMIAAALACRPSLLLADEPTTALDVTVQARILALLRSLQRETGMALLLITHDLGVVAQVADRVAVMYAGRIVEEADVRDLFRDPRHPYTEALLAAVPDPEAPGGRLETVGGRVPHPARWPAGCRFRPRCRYAWERCREEPPHLLRDGRSRSRCWLASSPVRRAGDGPAGEAGAGDRSCDRHDDRSSTRRGMKRGKEGEDR